DYLRELLKLELQAIKQYEKLRQTGDELVQAFQRLREIFDKGDDDSLEQVLEEIEELIQKHRQLASELPKLELQAIKQYREALEYVKLPVLAKILEDEEKHIEWLKEAAKQGDQWVQLFQRFREAIDKGDKDSLEQLLEELEQALQKIRELTEKTGRKILEDEEKHIEWLETILG
uniref:Two-domain di-Zn(II) and porphyrin-binding protein n=1 Tax=synthetic construct TaxID=32630 RepID=UPI0018C8D4B3|nr:Chain A, Two-domain di-Zn(II) and porphyrin-binding protein [synthetic construct]7JH6_B Chain B, Two-domain di-Zn(II) and porphyrin-binding protein [synthetic construct]7JH6_C Chain C, Two-domain di-Zn(II) and porphyrin-binding protein [synthetic construct]7JH6_D Chain D, Two-domain di-Zn(II) and porphyrin-binding protein [synthetic construct]